MTQTVINLACIHWVLIIKEKMKSKRLEKKETHKYLGDNKREILLKNNKHILKLVQKKI